MPTKLATVSVIIGQIMECIVTDTTGMYVHVSKISSETQSFNFVYIRLSHCIYVIKDVRVRGYFWKPRGISKQNMLDNTDL